MDKIEDTEEDAVFLMINKAAEFEIFIMFNVTDTSVNYVVPYRVLLCANTPYEVAEPLKISYDVHLVRGQTYFDKQEITKLFMADSKDC